MKTTLLMLLFVTAASPVLADPHRANRAEPPSPARPSGPM